MKCGSPFLFPTVAVCAWATVFAPSTRAAAVAVLEGAAERSEKAHWSFQRVSKPAVPAVRESKWASSDVDRFILAKLEDKGIAPAPRADKRTLIRRATVDLTGLPPTPEEIDNYVNDPSPDAFAHVIDRLLDSPRYGERWGRYWLDVARYADTKGYIFTEERKFPYSYTYRDWVIRALNEDLPYDQFLIQQIAADQLPLGDDKRPLAAMGFLTLGRRFLGNVHDIIDDRIDVVARGTMALTVGCARCHDHKYDPIPQADYYSLYGVFASSSEKQLAIPDATPEFEAELHAREKELNDFVEATLDETRHGLRTKAGEYLLAAESIRDHPDIMDFMFVENPGEINRFVLGRWRNFLERTSKGHHPVLAPWHAFAALPEGEFAQKAGELAQRFTANADVQNRINPMIARAFEGAAITSLGDVGHIYGKLFAEVEEAWLKTGAGARERNEPAPTALPDASQEDIRQVLYGDRTPAAITDKEADDSFEKPAADKLRQLRKKVQEVRTSPNAPPNAMALVESAAPHNPFVFVRGNPGNHGPAVPRQFLGVVAGENRQPFQNGSGRLELARAIATKDNPLTARVLVNRVWSHHFGAGLVKTPSDFGLRSDPPSHPELLDYLADWFVENGWSVKRLHRLIMLSSVYQQESGARRAEGQKQNRTQRIRGLTLRPPPSIDPDNRLLWRQNWQRLDFESMRDLLLAVSGDVDLAMGAPSVDLVAQPFSRRRTVYGFIERQNLPGMLRTFDFASPDTHCPQRFTTTVPQQALFLMNSPFVIEQACRLANGPDVVAQNDPTLRIQRMYRQVLGRVATPEEVSLSREFIEAGLASTSADPAAGGSQSMNVWEKFGQVLVLSNEFMFVD